MLYPTICALHEWTATNSINRNAAAIRVDENVWTISLTSKFPDNLTFFVSYLSYSIVVSMSSDQYTVIQFNYSYILLALE